MPPELLRSRVRRFGIALLCLKVALVPLIFDAASDQSFTVPKALLSHGLAYALVGVLAGLFVRFGRSFLVRSRLHYAVLAFLGVNVLATLFAPDMRLALFGAHGRMLGLGTVADWVVLYFAVVLLVRTRGETLTLLGSALAPTPIVLIYEFIQGAGRDPISWSTGNTERPFSTFGVSTALGEYLVILAAALIVVAIFLSGLSRGRRLLLGVWAGVLLVGAIRTGTRSILIGAGLSFVVVAAMVWLRGASRAQRIAVLAASGAAVLGLALVLAFTPLGQRVAATFVGGGGDIQVDPSTSGRLDLYRIALGMVVERPLLGYGPDSFAAGVPAHRPEDADILVRQSLASSAHGWVPFVLTGSGIAGFVAFLAVLALAAWTLFRRRTDVFALAGGAIASGFLGAGLTSVDDISVNWLFWLGLGLIVAGSAQAAIVAPATAASGKRAKARGGQPRGTAPALGPLNAPAVGAALGLLALLIIIPAWTASRESKASLEQRLGGNSRQAIEVGEASVRDDSGRAEYWHTLGFAYFSAQRYKDASNALARAVALAPYDILHANDEVQVDLVLASQGDQAAKTRALALSEQAVRIDPNNPRSHLLRATTLVATGDTAAAEAPIRRALALDPASTNEPVYTIAVQVLTATGHEEEAVTLARTGLPLISPRAVSLRYELARTLAKLGRTNEALTELDYILNVSPNHQGAQQLRAQLRGGTP